MKPTFFEKFNDNKYKMAIALNNCAIEYEYMGDLEQAMVNFARAT